MLVTLSAGLDLRVQSLTKTTDAEKSQAPSQRKKYGMERLFIYRENGD